MGGRDDVRVSPVEAACKAAGKQSYFIVSALEYDNSAMFGQRSLQYKYKPT